MGLLLSIHANGGYDVVQLDEEGCEGPYVEFVGYALSPYELTEIKRKFLDQGAIVEDHRSPEKLALADAAQEALERSCELMAHAVRYGGVEPEAIAKARRYADRLQSLATEESC